MCEIIHINANWRGRFSYSRTGALYDFKIITNLNLGRSLKKKRMRSQSSFMTQTLDRPQKTSSSQISLRFGDEKGNDGDIIVTSFNVNDEDCDIILSPITDGSSELIELFDKTKMTLCQQIDLFCASSNLEGTHRKQLTFPETLALIKVGIPTLPLHEIQILFFSDHKLRNLLILKHQILFYFRISL